MIYRVSRTYRTFVRLWAVLAIVLATLTAFMGGRWTGGVQYRVVLVAVMITAGAFLLIYAHRLGRTIETADDGVRVRNVSGQELTVPWDQITSITSHRSAGIVQVGSAHGTTLIIDHHTENVQDLVGEIVRRTGLSVSEEG